MELTCSPMSTFILLDLDKPNSHKARKANNCKNPNQAAIRLAKMRCDWQPGDTCSILMVEQHSDGLGGSSYAKFHRRKANFIGITKQEGFDSKNVRLSRSGGWSAETTELLKCLLQFSTLPTAS